MAKKTTPSMIVSTLDSPQVWIGAARQFKRLYEELRPLIEKETALRRDLKSDVSVKDRPIPLDGFDMFLMGVAIENLLKGFLRAKGRSYEEVVGMGHYLASLYETCCGLCGLTVNDDECEAMKKLEQFVIWVGKYNLPKGDLKDKISKAQEWGLLAIGSRDGPIITLEVSESERKSIYAVYERFLRYYNDLPPLIRGMKYESARSRFV